MPHDSDSQNPDESDSPFGHFGANEADLIEAAISHLRGVLPSGGGPFGEIYASRQEVVLREWALGHGRLLGAGSARGFFRRGGQEHDVCAFEGRIYKLTRVGMFGFNPGLGADPNNPGLENRFFRMWEATALQYLIRLSLHNKLVPGLNRFEGLVEHSEGGFGILTSQPRFEIDPASDEEIEEWFGINGFQRVTTYGYFNEPENIGIFDAHDRNVIKIDDASGLLAFDVIPCHPNDALPGFLLSALEMGKIFPEPHENSPPPLW